MRLHLPFILSLVLLVSLALSVPRTVVADQDQDAVGEDDQSADEKDKDITPSPHAHDSLDEQRREVMFSNLFNRFNMSLHPKGWAIGPTAFVLPFTQRYDKDDSKTCSQQIALLQVLLNRSPLVKPKIKSLNSCFSQETQEALKAFQMKAMSSRYTDATAGVFDGRTSQLLLKRYEEDLWQDGGYWPQEYQWKAHLPIYRNRMIDTVGKFSFRTPAYYDKVKAGHQPSDDDETVVSFYFISKTAGQPTRPHSGDVRSQFASNGATPSGLFQMDFTTPHPERSGFGPFPINSLMRGLQGNAGLVLKSNGIARTVYPNVRGGVYLHTGYWGNWQDPGHYMPVSHGCIHTHPNAIRHIWDVLSSFGVKATPHGNGHYQPRGLMSVEVVNTVEQEIKELQYQKGYWTQNNQISNHEYTLPSFGTAAAKDAISMLNQGPDSAGVKAGYLDSRPEYDAQVQRFIHLLDEKIAGYQEFSGQPVHLIKALKAPSSSFY